MFHIIINPTSKSGRGLKIWKELEPVLVEKEISYRLIYSEYSGHIAEIVHKLEIQATNSEHKQIKLILLGGDGTIDEALQGITDFSKFLIGYIPTGSSNDLARDLGYPTDKKELLMQILDGKAKRLLDLGIATSNSPEPITKRFAVSCGIGFDAAVCVEANAAGAKSFLNKIGLGKLTYLTIALKQLVHAKPVSCDLILDDTKTIHLNKFLFIASMLHRYEGGGFMFCPSADATDGIIDLCVAGNIPKWLILMALPTAFKGKHYRFKNIDAYTAQKIQIKTSIPLWIHTDGEASYQSNDLTITCEKQVIQFMA